MKKDKISAIIFDFDNTLVSNWQVLYKAYECVYNHFHMTPPTLEEIKSSMHRSLKDNFPNIFGDQWQLAAKIYYDNYYKYANEVTKVDDADELLNFVKAHNIPSAIISNKNGNILRSEITNLFHWDKYFDIVIGSTDLEKDKPSVIPVEHVAKTFKIPMNEDIWFIGDTETDVICANNSGCYSVLLSDQHEIRFTHKPRLQVRSLKEFIIKLSEILC